jgi:hypothetical protein
LYRPHESGTLHITPGEESTSFCHHPEVVDFRLMKMKDVPDRTAPAHLPTRREVIAVGGLSTLGLTLPVLLGSQSRGVAVEPNRLARDVGATFGRAKNCIFLWLQGGPPQHETFDPKPDAPVEIRGPFKPIATTVPGVRFCELLPRTARHAHELAVVRSLSTRDDNHDVSGYWVLTGYPYGPGSARQIKPTDWPYFGSVVKMLKPSTRLPALTTVWVPDVMRLNDNVTPAGQTAGFLGKQWEPERFVGDPAKPDYRIDGLDFGEDFSKERVASREALLGQLDRSFDRRSGADAVRAWDRLSVHAYDLVTSGAARAAFDLSKETDKTRDRYGRYTWGQSCLLARRLVEAGVRLVHVNWPREPGDSAVDNPLWDTHAQNADRLQDFLCPMFDVTFDALMNDLADRGLLSETLVVVVGEFGRTPKINAVGGRDHWGHVFSAAFAGAGVRGGSVVGASDKNGAYPVTDPISGGDFTATIYHLLGIDPHGMFRDKADRPHPLTKGEPIGGVLGANTTERGEPGGDTALVPPYDASLILDTDFTAKRPLIACTPPTREKGWRADPLVGPLAVTKDEPGVFVGFDAGGELPAGAAAVLAQEIRNARGGNYTFTVEAAGEAATADAFATLFAAHFECRLALIRYKDAKKDPRAATDLGSVAFKPEFAKKQAFAVDRFLGSRGGGSNFPIGNGLGVRLSVTKTTPGTLTCAGRAGLRVSGVKLEFGPAPRDDNNTDA